VEAVKTEVAGIVAKYPTMIEQAPIDELMSTLQGQVASFGQAALGFGLSSIPGVLTFAIYMVLIPLMVFFFLKDREVILRWVLSFFPTERPQLDQIGRLMNVQIANYVRGKGIEISIIGAVSYAAFTMFDLNYTALLALLVGLSVIVPYIGAFLVTIPVMLVALFQFGLAGDFYWVVGLYMLIQVLDGNVLVPLLFSEAVNLHPVAIIIAVLIFGGLWGVWGVFFAIPLATLCNVLLVSWPKAATE
jgi:putative permease